MPVESRQLRVAILTSHGAPGLEQLIADRNRGSVFEIVAVVSSETSFAELAAVEAAGIPAILRPIREISAGRGVSLHNMREREQYDRGTAEVLHALEVDYLFLYGYSYLLSDPLVDEFAGKIIALHDGDLTQRDEHGQRRYAGLHAVREALLSGAQETRASAFFVTREVAGGPLFLLSAPYPVSPLAADARSWGDADLLLAYADLHRRWMVRSEWTPMLSRAIEFLAAGRVQQVHDVIWVDGVPGPCRMGDAPPVCRDLNIQIESGIPASCPLIRSS